MSHEQTIYNYLKGRSNGAKTYEVNKYALEHYITDGGRILRKLQKKNKIIGEKDLFDKVKTWKVNPDYKENENNEKIIRKAS